MKKLFLFTCLSVFALTFNSCSDDDSSSSGNNTNETVISFKVNGVQKTFTSIVFEGETGENPYYLISANPNSNEPSESINFTFHGNEIGSDVIEHFHYKKGTFDYYWTRGQDTDLTHNLKSTAQRSKKGLSRARFMMAMSP